MCYGRGGARRRSPTRSWCSGIRRACWAARSRSRATWPREGSRRSAADLGLSPERDGRGHPRDRGLEPGQRHSAGERQARARLPRLHARCLRRLRPAAGRPPRRPAGPARRADPALAGHRVGLRPADSRSEERLRTDVRPAPRPARPRARRGAPDAARGAAPARRSRPRASRPRRAAFVRLADLRYFGQAWEVTVELPPGPSTHALAAETLERFHAAHEQRYGYSYRDGDRPPGSRVGEPPRGGHGPVDRPVAARPPRGDGRAERARSGTRASCSTAGLLDCTIYERARLQPGDRLDGPAIVEEFGSTTVVFPGQRVEVDRFGEHGAHRGRPRSDGRASRGRRRPHRPPDRARARSPRSRPRWRRPSSGRRARR